MAAAETAPEQRRETSAAGLPPLPGPRAKVKVEPCLLNQQFNAPLEHNVRGCVFSPLNAKKGEGFMKIIYKDGTVAECPEE